MTALNGELWFWLGKQLVMFILGSSWCHRKLTGLKHQTAIRMEEKLLDLCGCVNLKSKQQRVGLNNCFLHKLVEIKKFIMHVIDEVLFWDFIH